MPLLLIVVIAIIVVGAATAVTVPLIVGDPINPTPEAPIEVHGPAEPGAVNDALEHNADEETYVDPYTVYPTIADEDVGFFDEDGNRVEDEAPVRDVPDSRSAGGATNNLPDF